MILVLLLLNYILRGNESKKDNKIDQLLFYGFIKKE
jgi:hypothetical protein